MGFLMPSGGGGSQDNSAAEKQIAMQKEQITKQDAQLATQETNLAQKTQAGMKARRGGGLRSLLSAERVDSELGVTSKLGGM
jgi:hypothetical protein